MKFSRKALIAAAFAASSASALANVLTFQGVTFTTTALDADTLRLEIDAAGRNGDWALAVSMDALALKDVGSFTSVSMTGPGGAWTFDPHELNADGCAATGTPPGEVCFFHTPVALTDDMIFTYDFVGGVQDFSLPHLKVHFLDAQGNKEGSLLSLPIPEPETYALMLAGLGVLGWVARRRRAG